MITLLLFFLIGIALVALLLPNPLGAVILFSAFSMLSALLFYFLHAPDVALTEAAVGAGITTLIFVWAIHATSAREDSE